ncbi:MAG: phosphoesterase [Thermodesulfobacteriota bacterium]|nr:phosphoesterase [Thermodesulfobacteriota bacterium]
MNVESVLCVLRSELPDEWLQEITGIKMDEEKFYQVLSNVAIHWMSRDKIEHNRKYKQLIPYIVIQTADGLQMACYRRKGGEKRLHGLWSLGVGGHINMDDISKKEMPLNAVVTNGMQRELAEEFAEMPRSPQPVFHGIINEERTKVGHVHLGLVYMLSVQNKSFLKPGVELDSFSWIDTKKISEIKMELWSQIALDFLKLDREG